MSFLSNIINLSSFLASIGSLLAAYMAYRAVNEMKKQRQISVMPDLSIKGLKYHVYWHPTSFGIPVDWSREKLIEKPSFRGIFDNCRFSDAEMECINIGNGIAKNVKINWESDIDTFIKLLIEHDRYNLIDSLENPGYGGVSIDSKKLSGHFQFAYHVPYNKENIEFILPSSQDEEKASFSLSRPYMMLLSLKMYLEAYNLANRKDEDDINYFLYEDIPALTIILQYEDINKEKFTNKFKVKINFHDLTFPTEGIKEWRLAAKEIQYKINKIE